MSKIYVDPPSGWQYGFPKVYDPDTDGDVMKWLVESGYPQELIDSFGEHFYTRQWYQDEIL